MASCALIILDMQKGNFMEPQPIFNGEKLVAKIVLLINKMRSVHIPIVYIQNNGDSGDPDEPGTAG